MSWKQIVLLVLVVAAVWIYAVYARRRSSGKMLADRSDPRKQWIQAAMALYQGDQGDPGYWRLKKAQDVMAEGWSTPNREELLSLIQSYKEGECNTAFDKLRIIWLARLGAGAGWIDDAASWEYAFQAAAELKSAYGSWDELYRACVDGRREWNGGELSESQVKWSADNFAYAQKTILSQTPYK